MISTRSNAFSALAAGLALVMAACGPSLTAVEDWSGWDQLVGGGGAALEVERFSSLGAMTQLADVVLEGTIRDVGPGRDIPGLPADDSVGYALVTIEILQLIRGSDPGLPTDYKLEVMVTGDDWASIRNAMVGKRGLFFLRNKGVEAHRLGMAQDVVEGERHYYRLVSSQGLILDRGGDAYVALGDPDDELVKQLAGKPYSSLVPTP